MKLLHEFTCIADKHVRKEILLHCYSGIQTAHGSDLINTGRLIGIPYWDTLKLFLMDLFTVDSV